MSTDQDRDRLEIAMVRAGLTRDQIVELLPAIDAYATAQALAALSVLSLPEVVRR